MQQGKYMKRFGTFEGVFTPSILAILGVVMYLRVGWVVGNTGFFGAIAIIIIANLIALATALSMSSIVTNIRIYSSQMKVLPDMGKVYKLQVP